jgi:U3 small nucleolar RNA-associated protein 18
MGKHSRKRQKIEKSASELVQPLGTPVSLTDDASKDDEERRLESLLFGVPFVPSRKDNTTTIVISDEGEEQEDLMGGGQELENMLDTDVSSSSSSSILIH